jgi:hypothetical protein
LRWIKARACAAVNLMNGGFQEPFMSKLGILIYILTAPVIAGVLMIAVLSMPPYRNNILIGAGLLGFAMALPVAWAVTKKLSQNVRF